MSDVAIRSTATVPVPDDYKIPGAQELLPKSVSAHMDGSGTGAAWFPVLQIVDPAGNVMGSAIANASVAAGASADVTWFPGGRGVTATASSGIQYDTLNDGGWFVLRADSDHSFTNDHGDFVDATEYFETNGTGGFAVTDYGGGGISLSERGDGGIAMDDNGAGGISFQERGTGGITFGDGDGIVSAGGIRLTEQANGNGIVIRDNSTGGLFVNAADTGGLFIEDQGGGGFFMVTSAAGLFISGLPTSAPGGSKQVWNNGGVLNITP